MFYCLYQAFLITIYLFYYTDHQLCLSIFPRTIQRFYFSDTQLQSSSVFSTSQGTKSYDYIESPFLQTTTATYYDQNQTIAAFVNSTIGLVALESGFMELPIADFSGTCTDNNFVKFENNVNSNMCLRKVIYTTQDAFNAQCSTKFSASKYVQSLWIAKYVISTNH